MDRLRDATLVLSHLPVTVPQADVELAFKQFGPLRGVKLETADSDTSRRATIQMENKEDAMNARKELHGSLLGGCVVSVTWAVTKRCIWIGDLAPTVTGPMLKEAFSRFGEVERAYIATNPSTLRSKGYG
eukprot:c1043_g1_i2.p1 GENE.c1043_g1_i2~~c1043_g1_i2.p1  ORF type:complete len:130 (+),score=14.87 c1043_g1_i2:54-443(+)